MDGPAPDSPFRDSSETQIRLGDDEWAPLSALLTPMINDLRRAAHFLRLEQGLGGTYQTTAALNEGVLRALRGKRREWNDDRHFFNYLKTAIRSALADIRRKRITDKRSGSLRQVDLADVGRDPATRTDSFEATVIAIIDAYRYQSDLKTADPEAYSIFVLHFVEGMSLGEAAELTGLTPRQAKRRWQNAVTYLRLRVADDEAVDDQAPTDGPHHASPDR